MKKNIIILVLTFISLIDVLGYNSKFPDSSGFLLPGYTYSEEAMGDAGFYVRQYDISGNNENIYTFFYNYRTAEMLEFGFLKNFYSQDNLRDPDAVYSLKLNIADFMFRNIYTIGFIFDTEHNNYNSIYVLKDNIGIGWNFSGNKGGDAFFGGYDTSMNEPDEFFILLKYDMALNEKTKIGFEFNGDDISMFMKYRYGDSVNFSLGYISENEYDKKYAMLDNDRIVIGVDCVF